MSTIVPHPAARPLTVVAHRGDPFRYRENTVPSLRSALARGADAVETDVRLTRDGVPVLLHDDTLKRLWGLDVPLASLTADELDDRTGGGVPTLARALHATGDRRVLIDLPGATPRTVRQVLGVVRECAARERVYYCAGAEAMLSVRAQDPAAEIALTWRSTAPPRPALLDAIAPRWLNYRFGVVDERLVARVRGAGLLLSVWTPDTRRAQRRLLRLGVDAITTNRVDTLGRLRAGR